ncbi:MAG: hypothetical protein EAZ78_20975 [Oscillatoriales cyanobacterium]|uniref:Myosin heavy chain n=1 Tax=Microcoleus anatoxicus PTRS2 TaxID=2705321 RepID=A0ABU8YI10_9CYAN|nr:MAG: hypothetical protein EA000_22000 [Oscillatoriales cyanobacterium]TAD92799.1 MAG: hypothetical protein EAZ98_24935 [Oscillatoriales cyanobacterium]TAE01601.1 MAG: hypothetical protein EAZ96_18515 [Oscillatoriales cyanobacterium]TAE99987.1 MAG: hypothetical protein EAZ78_20975 [Oscillatoriales cyanobacterium]TAF62708.1 MAG: hypothetical protein EAZ59_23095 [Oscillatoriales cyanobacterium]
MNKKVSDKSTKAEILEAYKEAAEAKAALELQLKQVNKSQSVNVSQKQTVVPEKAIIEVNKPMVVTQTQQKMQATIDNLILLQFGFGGAVSELSEKLTSEASKLEELRRNVGEEVQQLQELHSLEDVAEDTLDNLIQEYEESAKTFTEEITQQREAIEQELLELRKAWEKEQQLQELAVQERNDSEQKVRDRDEELYDYDLELQRNLDIEEYEQRQQRLYKEIEEFKQEQEKQWAEREKSIAEREKLYAEVKAKVEAFPKELEANIKNGKDNGRNIGNYQAKVKADLFAKDLEGQKQNYELQIQGMLQTIQNQESRIASLSKQLDSALKQVQDLAVKAIEGASNLNSFQAVKEIAIEQAKTQQKNK